MIAASRIFALLRGLRPWRATCAALAILLFTSTAFAALPLTGTFRGKVIGRLVTFTTPQQRTVTDWAGVLGLQLDRDRPGDSLGPRIPVFCIQVNVAVRGGDRYKSDGSVTALHGGCQIRYLLDRYPASTATTADEAAARQVAIWHFSDDVDLTTVQDPAIQARATALANEAALAVALGGCPGSQTSVTSLTLDPPAATVVTGQVLNYTVRADPPGAAQSVEIAISGSATLTNGQHQATLPLTQGVASFSIVNQVAGASTITARLPYALDAGTVFSPIDASRPTQRLVMGERVTLTASATVQAVWAPATATPVSAPPVTDTPISGPPVTATPVSGPPVTDTPISGPPVTATPVSGPPITATPVSAPPVVNTPTSVAPTNIPPATPTHKPPSGSKPPSAPAPQTTPVNTSTPPNGSSIPPAGGPPGGSSGPGGPQSPTPGGSGGPGSAGGSGGTGAGSVPGSGGTPIGGESSASGAGGTGGATIPRPAQLPNTGDAGDATQLVLALAALLIAGGALLRGRARRT